MQGVVSAYKSDVGRVREHNEDYIWIDEPAGVYVLADGLGGHASGEVASKLASETVGAMMVAQVKEAQQFAAVTIKEMLITALEQTNQRVRLAASQNFDQHDMGTTLVVALCQLPQVYICHAGDSRAYWVHESTLIRLTEDDSWVMAWDVFADDQAQRKKNRHILTKAVGQELPLEPQFKAITVATGDWLLLCSDGLWDMLSDDQLLAYTQQAITPADLVDVLVSAANEAGGKDNISVIAMRVSKE